MIKKYRKRIADELLAKKLQYIGAVLIQGPKWCGKTTTAEQAAKSILYMDDPENGESNLIMANTEPKKLLDGATPRLIDEWQLAPSLWDSVRFTVDHRDGFGQFILTGSAVPVDTSQIHHTGTGRFSWMTMRPMSLYESGESNGTVSLANLFTSPEKIAETNNLNFEDIAFLICRGGWPQAVNIGGDLALNIASEYYNAVVESDISRADNISRNPSRVKRLLRSYSRHQGSQAPIRTIKQDLLDNEASSFDDETINSYINALKKIFVVDDIPAWNPNLRSKTAIRTSDTRYLVDPSIGAAALEIGPKDLINDLNTMGLLFETLCIRDLRVFAESLDGNIYHYRDHNGLECDAVIHLKGGAYGLIEIKLGGSALIEQGANTLLKLASKIDTTKMKIPSFMMVLTAVGKYAYRRDDGVYVVPIGCLKN